MNNLSISDLKCVCDFCFEMSVAYHLSADNRKVWSDRHVEAEKVLISKVEGLFSQQAEVMFANTNV